MHIKVLGCSGGAVANASTTSFLLDKDTLIDAGTGVLNLSLQEQQRIKQVFLTHAHFDHTAGLPFLIENVACHRYYSDLPPIKLYGSQATLNAIQNHLFNDSIWPDFTKLPSVKKPAIEMIVIEVGAHIALSKHASIEAVGAIHTVPTQGYAVHHQGNTWIYTGDTKQNPALWDYINRLPQQGKKLRWLVTEATFANTDQKFADLSGHCTVNNLVEDISKHLLHGQFELHAMHLKPQAREQVLQELEDLRTVLNAKNCSLHVLQQGQIFDSGVVQSMGNNAALHVA